MDKEPADSQEDTRTSEPEEPLPEEKVEEKGAELLPEEKMEEKSAEPLPDIEREDIPPLEDEPPVKKPEKEEKKQKKQEKSYTAEEIEEIQKGGGLKGLMKRWQLYAQISKLGLVARRFFVKNMTDGILTTLGVVIGFLMIFLREPTDLPSNSIIVLPGIGTAVAMCVSGVLASYLTESAERRKALLEIRREMMILEPVDTKKKKTKTLQERAESFATLTASLIDGFSPFVAALFVLIPFYFAGPNLVEFIVSIGLSLILLFFLGSYLGRLSKVNIIYYGIKMTILGVLTFLFTWALTFIEGV